MAVAREVQRFPSVPEIKELGPRDLLLGHSYPGLQMGCAGAFPVLRLGSPRK